MQDSPGIYKIRTFTQVCDNLQRFLMGSGKAAVFVFFNIDHKIKITAYYDSVAFEVKKKMTKGIHEKIWVIFIS